MPTKVHRATDSRSCGALTIVTGQSTVKANGLLIAVEGDECSHGSGDLVSTSPGTVKINGKKIIIITDTNTATDDEFHPSPDDDPDTGSDTVKAY